MSARSNLTVRRLMNPNAIWVKPEESVQDSIDQMTRRRVGALLVIQAETERLLGIFTERDFIRRAVDDESDWRRVPVSEWMSPQPYTIHPDSDWDEAVTSMERLQVRHLPVVENGKVVGIITSRQLMSQRTNYLNQIVGDRTRELRLANDALLARDSELTYYMKAAAKLQKRLVLPQSPPNWEEVSWGIHFAPLDPLGGDYYDFARPDNDHIGVLISDASGHSIPAAMVAIMARLAFAESSPLTTKPGEVLAAMNRRLVDLTDERFVTGFYGILDRRTRTFTYANAGHPFPLRYRHSTGLCEELSARGFLLGITPDEVYTEKSVVLEPGDRLLFFTDGVLDSRDERGESLGTSRLAEMLKNYSTDSAKIMMEHMAQDLNTFCGNVKPIDDITMLVAEIS
jgi:sigma-B regulation protein RsbU (phosphoserine phosphatase)